MDNKSLNNTNISFEDNEEYINTNTNKIIIYMMIHLAFNLILSSLIKKIFKNFLNNDQKVKEFINI